MRGEGEPARPDERAAPRPDGGDTHVLVLGARSLDDLPGLPRLPGVSVTAASDERDVVAMLPEAEVVFAWQQQPPLLERHWDLAGRLRWVQAASAGVERSLFPALVESAVVLTNSGGVFDAGMAEYAFALLLALVKDIRTTIERQRIGEWQHRVVRGLRGHRLLIVGAGPIGRATARLGRAFGMEVTVVARTAREDPEIGRVHEVERLGDLIAEADAIILVLPLTPGTRGLVGSAALARARGAFLVNIGRGPTLDTLALLDALDDGRLAAAALDVFEEEPLPPGSPLWLRRDVLVSPHIGGDIEGFEARLVEAFVENLRRYRAGEPLEHVVDKRLGYPRAG